MTHLLGATIHLTKMFMKHNAVSKHKQNCQNDHDELWGVYLHRELWNGSY